MSDKREFSIADGLNIQAGNLKFWKGLLKPEIFTKLLAAVKEATDFKELKSGYDVPRGQDIDQWLMNIHNDYNPLGR